MRRRITAGGRAAGPTRWRFGLVWEASFVLAAVCASTTATTAADTTLRWSLEPGTQFDVRLTQTTRTETAVKGAVTAVRIESGFDVRWAVDRVSADGTMRLTQTFTRLWLKTVSPDGKSNAYDSAAVEAPAADARTLADSVRALLRVRISMDLSRQGEILGVERPAEMDSLLGDQPGLAGWKALLTKEGMSRTLQLALGRLPEAPVKLGDRWTGRREMNTPLGRIVTTDTYSYDGPSRDGPQALDIIRVATDVKLADGAASPAAAERLPRQQLEGVYGFDAAAGFLAQSRLTQTLLSEVPYAGGKVQVKTVSTLETRLMRTPAR